MSPRREIKFEKFLQNFPNLVADELIGVNLPTVSQFGKTNVCVEQGGLPECNGRIDLAWITDTSIHLVELKRGSVTESTLHQFERYRDAVQERYPKHQIFGYLVGKYCSTRKQLETKIGRQNIKILLMGINIPYPGEVTHCPDCKAAVHSKSITCRYCGATL
ncbi:MAG: hypothetical protein ACLQPD_26895 [Desulfomonilaceae bacterium]